MPRPRFNQAELTEWLAQGELASVRLTLDSEAAARALRQALYHHRKKHRPSRVSVTTEGRQVIIAPMRDEVLSAEILHKEEE